MRNFIFLTILWFTIVAASAQTPQSFRYQAVARDNSGKVLSNQSVSFRISILSGSVSGIVAYSETHTSLTNAFGLVELEIGKGLPVTGTFSSIDWASSSYFVKIEMDPAGGTAYQVLSTSQLLSVPYALHAKTVETGDNWGSQAVVTDATLTGTGTSASNLKLAQQSATSGQVLKWNGTIWAPAADATGGSPTGAAGGDLSGTYPNPLIGDNKVTSAKILDGGVGNADLSDNAVTSPKITDGAVATADLADLSVTSGKLADNAVTGSKIAQGGAISGQVLKWNNTTWAPANDDHGPFYESTNYIYAGTNKNVGIGTAVPTQKLTLADESSPCYMNIQNINSGYTSYDGMFLGMSGLNSYVSSYEAGNLYLGTNADIRMAIVSDGRVGIGTLSPSYKLDVKGPVNLNKGIASGPALLVNADEAVWYDGTYFSWGYGGLFNVFHDPVGIACQPGDGHLLAVNGVASKPGGGTWTAFSDIRLKDIRGNYQRGLNDILRLQPVRFNYKKDNSLNFSSEIEYVGFVAQDVQKVFPESVTGNKNGYLELDMNGVNAAVINAIKELKAENDRLKLENEQLNTRLGKIEALIIISAEK